MPPRAERLAFVAPRFADGPIVGGAETLLRALAARAARAGRRVTFLTTCATSHFTWENDRPAGRREVDGMEVRFFPVNADRDLDTFVRVQHAISAGAAVSPAEERAWLANNVNSRALTDYLREHADAFDAIVAGPYLFGLIHAAAMVRPEKTLLVPCLHDEPFARLAAFRELFAAARGILFNTAPERDLARRLFGPAIGAGGQVVAVVGLGLEPFEADPAAFARRHGLAAPYVVYCGRREPLKGTPLLMDYLAAFRARTARDVRLVLTGSGRIDPPPELAPFVVDAGVAPEAEKREAMAGGVAFCHPSVNESLGIVLLEAWLARTPALVHGMGEVLRWQCERSNAGLWFRTYPEFEEELLRLLDDAALRRAMGQAGRRYVLAEYGWDAVERRLLAALDQASSLTRSEMASIAR